MLSGADLRFIGDRLLDIPHVQCVGLSCALAQRICVVHFFFFWCPFLCALSLQLGVSPLNFRRIADTCALRPRRWLSTP